MSTKEYTLKNPEPDQLDDYSPNSIRPPKLCRQHHEGSPTPRAKYLMRRQAIIIKEAEIRALKQRLEFLLCMSEVIQS
jgi:hypothetical protein